MWGSDLRTPNRAASHERSIASDGEALGSRALIAGTASIDRTALSRSRPRREMTTEPVEGSTSLHFPELLGES
jgi:hypothetical protein